MLFRSAKIDLLSVPFKSTGATTTDLLAGRTQLILGGLVPLQPYIQAGRLRPIAVTTAKRWHSLPDVAAMAEALPRLPSDLGRGWERLQTELAGRSVLRIIVLLAAFLALGYGCQAVWVRLMRRPLQRLSEFSFDTPAENLAFAKDQQFPYRLLSDVDRVAGAAYGVVRNSDDQYAAFPKRMTFLIDPTGVVRKVYAVTDVDKNPQDVLDDIDDLRG